MFRAVAIAAMLGAVGCGAVGESEGVTVEVSADGAATYQGVPAEVDVGLSRQGVQLEGDPTPVNDTVLNCKRCECTKEKCVCTDCRIEVTKVET